MAVKHKKKKSEETLKAGLNHSADKRGLSGKERHRYIGGALRNMGKAKNRPKAPPKQRTMFGVQASAPVKKKRRKSAKSK